MKKILINASNLHVGGGIQVAASFIHELSGLLRDLLNWELTVYASSAVDENLASSGFDYHVIYDYQVLNVHGLEALNPFVAKKFYGYDIVFSIFGPLYLPRLIKNHIVGFAQPWIIYPENDVTQNLTLKTIIMLKIKFMLQWRFFKTADRLVVELQHVKNRLVKLRNFPLEHIDVVYNCISSVYLNKAQWLPIARLEDFGGSIVKIGYVTRDYPHKNLNFLLDVARELKHISSIRYHFYVTLTPTEWVARSPEFKEYVLNVGSLNVAQCPTFYEAMDGVIFPSLLECFSATPLEAMVMRRPLFASKRDFVYECCSEYPIYVDPLDARHAAKRIDDWFCRTTEEFRINHIDRAYRHIMSLPSSKDRAMRYIEVIRKQLLS